MPAPRRRASSRRPWTNATAPTSSPRVGWSARIRRGVELEHAAQQQLLDVAAREQADPLARPLAAHVVGPRSGHGHAGPAGRGAGSPAAGRPGGGRSRAPGSGRSAARRPRPRPGGPPGFGRRRPRPPRPAPPAGQGRPPGAPRLPRGGARPGEQAGQRPLAVARDAGDADDLVRVDGEARRPRRPSRRGRARRHRAAPGPGPPGFCASRRGRLTGRPTMASAMAAGLVPRTGNSATLRPPRSTATRRHRRITSSSLWLMNRIARPRSRPARSSVANRPSASCGVSTAVGSSRIRTRTSR